MSFGATALGHAGNETDMNEDDLPVAVFSGQHSDAAFLVSFLESEGINASLEKHFMGIDLAGAQRLLVRRRDAQCAAELVEVFRRNRGGAT
jgi:hypothetical protein